MLNGFGKKTQNQENKILYIPIVFKNKTLHFLISFFWTLLTLLKWLLISWEKIGLTCCMKVMFKVPDEMRWDGFCKSPWKCWTLIPSIRGSKTEMAGEALVDGHWSSTVSILEFDCSFISCGYGCGLGEGLKSRRDLPSFRELQSLGLLKHLELEREDVC